VDDALSISLPDGAQDVPFDWSNTGMQSQNLKVK